MRAAHLADGFEKLPPVHTELVGEGEQEVLEREVVVAHLATALVGALERRDQLLGEPGTLPAVGPGESLQGPAQPSPHRARVDADALEQREGEPVGLGDRREEHVGRRHLGVVRPCGLPRRLLHRLLGLQGPTVRLECHRVVVA